MKFHQIIANEQNLYGEITSFGNAILIHDSVSQTPEEVAIKIHNIILFQMNEY